MFDSSAVLGCRGFRGLKGSRRIRGLGSFKCLKVEGKKGDHLPHCNPKFRMR